MATCTIPVASQTQVAPNSSSSVPPRSRTTSLFSTVSSKMRFGVGTAKGKGKADAAPESRKSFSFARRLSGGTSTRPAPPRSGGMPLGELNGAGSGMAGYRERAGTYSRSSPELNGTESAYQPWPVLAIHDDDDEEDDLRLGAAPIPISPSRGPRSARAAFEPPSIPFTRTISASPTKSILSPEEEETRRQASRAEALAKLTETRPAFAFPPSPAPPRPSRTPPPPPLAIPPHGQTRWSVEREWLVEDPAIRRRRSATPDKRERHRSAGEISHSATAGAPLFQPILHAPSPTSKPPKSSARYRSSGNAETTEDERRLSASSLSPAPLPIDINLRGWVVRARSTNAGHAQRHSFDNSTASDSSPGSSKFTDYSFGAPGGGRKSLEVPPPSTISSATSTGPSVTFVERVKGIDREKDWGAPGVNVGSNKIYGDRRMAESAIDVLSVVEEDDSSSGIHVPKRAVLGRQSSSPSPTPRRAKRYSSDAPAPVLWLDGGASPRPRQRHSSEAVRPIRLVQRSFSSSAAEQTAMQREEFGPIKISPELKRRSNDSALQQRHSTPSSEVPFPSSADADTPDSRASPTPVGPRPRQHKRWNSELYVERPVVTKEEYVSPARSRHESFQSPSPMKGQRVTRTKLVLREEGRPTLTYQLGECIGRGQFGSVYRALNLNSGRVVAVKRILLEGKSEEEVQQLSNEVSLLKSLTHPSVVKYEGLVRTEHYLNIVLEFIENGSLQKTLKAFGELPEGLVASYVVKILEGLDYLHSQNVVHCDLKAANILTTKNGNIKLADFGVSLNLNALQNQKADHDVNGTPNWMAPEVIELKGASTASDIWSLGCTIVELIDGKPPYSEMGAMSAMFRIVEDDRPPIPERCSPELFDFLARCFAKEPQDRPTANDLFAHEWLQSNWDPRKDLRPQDSIPFLRRISSEMRRPELTSTFDSPSPLGRPPSPGDDPFSISPGSPRGHMFPDLVARDSFDGGRPNLRESLSFVRDADDSPRPHAFVKTTFSKEVDCRVCGDSTKRHSVLCSACGLIAHARCVEFAPSCNLRAQLLSYSTTNLALRSPLSRAPTISTPSSPILSPTSPSTSFSLGDILPFGKSRRPKFTPTSSDSSVALGSTDTHGSGSTPTRPSNAFRHLSDLIGVKSRTPEPTPPSSLSKSYTHVASGSFGSLAEGHSVEDGIGRGRPPPLQARASTDSSNGGGGHSNALSRKLSLGGQKLRRGQSHGRSVSQPVNKPAPSSKGGEDCVVQ